VAVARLAAALVAQAEVEAGAGAPRADAASRVAPCRVLQRTQRTGCVPRSATPCGVTGKVGAAGAAGAVPPGQAPVSAPWNKKREFAWQAPQLKQGCDISTAA
jgi:hypothetical protein